MIKKIKGKIYLRYYKTIALKLFFQKKSRKALKKGNKFLRQLENKKGNS